MVIVVEEVKFWTVSWKSGIRRYSTVSAFSRSAVTVKGKGHISCYHIFVVRTKNEIVFPMLNDCSRTEKKEVITDQQIEGKINWHSVYRNRLSELRRCTRKNVYESAVYDVSVFVIKCTEQQGINSCLLHSYICACARAYLWEFSCDLKEILWEFL